MKESFVVYCCGLFQLERLIYAVVRRGHVTSQEKKRVVALHKMIQGDIKNKIDWNRIQIILEVKTSTLSYIVFKVSSTDFLKYCEAPPPWNLRSVLLSNFIGTVFLELAISCFAVIPGCFVGKKSDDDIWSTDFY